MLGRARRAVALASANVTPCRADAEQLPQALASIDVALVNGIFNLNPSRPQIFQQLARVLRHGGAVVSAELILMEAVSKPDHFTEAEWFARITGAKEGGAFLDEFRQAGFREAAIVRTTRNARCKDPRVIAAEVCARR
ncbi:MAG TPA: methyltransferase domain-containing protein [Methylomirabilota bacterium]|nr:methyltransferase domain-containing protein [Methylomirabilota bacterium]